MPTPQPPMPFPGRSCRRLRLRAAPARARFGAYALGLALALALAMLPAAPAVAAAATAAGAASAAATTPSGAATQPAEHRVPDTIAQRVQACTVCHGEQGRATSEGYFPRIAGKPAGYLYNQLVDFRDGRRSNATMTYLVEFLSDAYLHEIADYFAAQNLPYPPPQTHGAPAALLERGAQFVRHGRPEAKVPACVACHGAALTGVAPAIPGLLGLPRDYLISQLGSWQNGLRRARPPDCMAQVAKLLSADEISAIATWLSSQPVPADSRPAQTLPAALPLECGSVPH